MKTQAISSNALIFNDKKEVLVIKRSDNDDAFPSEWELPGGQIEYGESSEESLVREVEEECGLIVNVGKPLHVTHFYVGEDQCFEITHLCELIPTDQEIKLSEEHADYRWVRLDDIRNAGLNKFISSILINSKKALNL